MSSDTKVTPKTSDLEWEETQELGPRSRVLSWGPAEQVQETQQEEELGNKCILNIILCHKPKSWGHNCG